MNSTYWWRDSVGYIIYPSSFYDSNGDGVGDIPGIVSKLDYLRDLGINLLWICPLFDSPMDDNGYDVRDFYKINPLYGTNEDLIVLLKEAHARGIRVCLDFVLNHTSDEHPWFQKAIIDSKAKERDYYYIRKGKIVDGKLCPPNNWKGFFATSAWERIEGTDEYYLHIFSKKMPDLNWSNPDLRQEMYAVARHYLDLGVDGFRLDALAHLAKDMSFSDSHLPADQNGLVADFAKFSNRPELYMYLREFKEEVLSHYDCLTLGEVGGSVTPEEALRYANFETGSINMVFNFDTAWSNGAFGSIDKKDEEIQTDVIGIKNAWERWYHALKGKADMPVYWDNHDHPRVLSQYGSTKYRNESAKALLTLLLFLYGTPFIYNGEEIGMSNVNYPSVDDFKGDVADWNCVLDYRQKGYSDEQILRFLRRCSRTNARTPFQWNAGQNAGFSSGTPKFKVNDNYKDGVNALDEMNDPYSTINYAQYAIGIRKQKDIARIVNGNFEILDRNHPDVMAYMHQEGEDRIVVIANMRPYETKFGFYYGIQDVYLHNYGEAILENHVFSLRPFECFVLRI